MRGIEYVATALAPLSPPPPTWVGLEVFCLYTNIWVLTHYYRLLLQIPAHPWNPPPPKKKKNTKQTN